MAYTGAWYKILQLELIETTSVCWLWRWFLRYIHLLKLIEMYSLNGCSFLGINYIMIKLLKIIEFQDFSKIRLGYVKPWRNQDVFYGFYKFCTIYIFLILCSQSQWKLKKTEAFFYRWQLLYYVLTGAIQIYVNCVCIILLC